VRASATHVQKSYSGSVLIIKLAESFLFPLQIQHGQPPHAAQQLNTEQFPGFLGCKGTKTTRTGVLYRQRHPCCVVLWRKKPLQRGTAAATGFSRQLSTPSYPAESRASARPHHGPVGAAPQPPRGADADWSRGATAGSVPPSEEPAPSHVVTPPHEQGQRAMAAATELRIDAPSLSRLSSLAGAGEDLESSAAGTSTTTRSGSTRWSVRRHGREQEVPLLLAPTAARPYSTQLRLERHGRRLASPPADGPWPPSPRAAGGRGPAAPRARRLAGEHLHPTGSRSPRAGQHLHRASEGDRGGWRGRRESAGSGGGGPCSAELRPPGVGEEARAPPLPSAPPRTVRRGAPAPRRAPSHNCAASIAGDGLASLPNGQPRHPPPQGRGSRGGREARR
jgi:hypothetical protein